MRKQVTVYDIADRLGISPSTVSRVFNDSILVSSETRERTLEAAEQMGYRKRKIRRQQSRTILNVALVIPHYDRSSVHLFYDPAELVDGLETGLGEVRSKIGVTLSDSSAGLFDHKKLGDLDGCVFAFSLPDLKLRAELRRWNVPWVALNRVSTEFNFVATNNAGGMMRLVEQAVSRWGQQLKPCYIGFRPIESVSRQREQGFDAGLRQYGLERSVATHWDIDAIQDLTVASVRTLVDRGVNAVFCFNDVVAVYFYQVAVRAGFKIPDDISLSGFDHSPVRDLLIPPLDTVSLSVHRLGKEAGCWLRACVIERKQDPIHLLVDGEYVPGETIHLEAKKNED
ncbi:MAG TPA: LacI family DNA-binding transcriptional regulator [Spirochaetia bacterium]|nr:LacI family DNA-binding transcriptional regulator [Spirochaetia bacterium]